MRCKAAGINPAYLAAQTDKKGRFTQKTVNAFLSSLGYDVVDEAPTDESESEPETVPEEAADVPPVDGSAETAAIECDACDAPDEPIAETAPAAVLSDDDLYTLLKALLIKAQVSEEAKKILAEIQGLLIR